jgi:hypothetical protein
MVRHGEESSGGHYILYLEYLGGLIPLLKGKRASKLRPDFVVYDPKIKPTYVGNGKLRRIINSLHYYVYIPTCVSNGNLRPIINSIHYYV